MASVVRSAEAIAGFYVLKTDTVSTNSQVVISELATIARAIVWKESDFSDVTCTWTGRIITITQAGLTAVRVIILAGGQK